MVDSRVSGSAHAAGGAEQPLNHRERLLAAIRGEEVRPVPVAFWHHFPEFDGDPATFADATVAFYRRYQVDLVKLMPTGMYSVVDYGVKIRPSDDDLGTTVYVSGPIAGESDWEKLPSATPDKGLLADQVAMVRRVRAALGPDVPVIQTIFSPLSMAAKLAGGDLGAVLGTDAATMQRVLGRLAADVVAFGRACLEAGADGFFFATQVGNAGSISRDDHARYGEPFDLQVLEALRPDAWLQMLHLHGIDPFFELADRYPVDIVNWEDRETAPSLRDALGQTTRCLLGGVARGQALVSASRDEIAAQVRDAVAQTGGRRLIVGAGCVVSITTPAANLQAVVDASRVA